jgi:hypothetical protein
VTLPDATLVVLLVMSRPDGYLNDLFAQKHETWTWGQFLWRMAWAALAALFIASAGSSITESP